jgi:hypothetical protein
MLAVCAALFLSSSTFTVQAQSADGYPVHSGEIREALRLKEKGMTAQSTYNLAEIADKTGSADAEGLSVLGDVLMRVPGYENRINAFVAANPHSLYVTQIYFAHGLNRFDSGDYAFARKIFGLVELKDLYEGQKDEYLFRKAYCDLEAGRFKDALDGFYMVENVR